MARALHYVFKIADRKKTFEFFVNRLRMQVLRHEEFEEGCKATCNGPYDGKWSKTMVGYGPEDSHFVIELTYNYTVHSYHMGNDFEGVYIQSSSVYKECMQDSQSQIIEEGFLKIKDPDGHSFFVKNIDKESDPVYKVALNTTDLDRTYTYWTSVLGMKEISKNEIDFALSFGENQCIVEWKKISGNLTRGTGFGRIAFSIGTKELEPLQSKVKENDGKIHTPLVELDTPGKETVTVVILADPNDHEICFVGDEGFRELSKVDEGAQKLLEEAIKGDKSEEWLSRRKARD